jgi:hypothetical protein
MAEHPEVLDTVPEKAPDTIATPEGDNEQPPDQPLSPDEPAPERPRGDEPHSVEPLRDAL